MHKSEKASNKIVCLECDTQVLSLGIEQIVTKSSWKVWDAAL